MALDLGDPRTGFHHSEVMEFINEEVVSNGGGSDFYLTHRSQSWNEIEEALLSVLANPQLPRTIKRASAWSALALGVRVGARQREQQACTIRQLREQGEERDAAFWAMTIELQQLREERQELFSQLLCARGDLRQLLAERQVLHRRLLQAESCTPAHPLPEKDEPQLQVESPGSGEWSVGTENQNEAQAAGPPSRPDAESKMASKNGVLPVSGSPSPWVQMAQPPLPVVFPRPFPMAFPYLPPPPFAVVAEMAAKMVWPPYMPARGPYISPMWSALGPQEEAALWRGPRNQDQEEDPVRSQEINPARLISSEEDPREQQTEEACSLCLEDSETFSETEEAPARNV